MEPTIITFVIFPWSGETTLNFDSGSRDLFCKKFADHFFGDYVSSSDPASKYNPKFKTSISADEVTKHLSGLIFLKDNLILSKDPSQVNVEATYAWNANARHPLAGQPFDAAAKALGARELF